MQIPRDQLTIRFARSGGPGGQNVNKVETKVEIRFQVAAASWLPLFVRQRLQTLQPANITRDGELVISSSRFRSQTQNLEDCMAKLERLIEAAARRPKRRIPSAPTRGSKERRARWKAKRSDTKRRRGWKPDE